MLLLDLIRFLRRLRKYDADEDEEAIRRMARHGPRAIPALRYLLRSNRHTGRVKRAAVTALERIGGADAAAALARVAEDRYCGYDALRALERMSGEKARTLAQEIQGRHDEKFNNLVVLVTELGMANWLSCYPQPARGFLVAPIPAPDLRIESDLRVHTSLSDAPRTRYVVWYPMIMSFAASDSSEGNDYRRRFAFHRGNGYEFHLERSMADSPTPFFLAHSFVPEMHVYQATIAMKIRCWAEYPDQIAQRAITETLEENPSIFGTHSMYGDILAAAKGADAYAMDHGPESGDFLPVAVDVDGREVFGAMRLEDREAMDAWRVTLYFTGKIDEAAADLSLYRRVQWVGHLDHHEREERRVVARVIGPIVRPLTDYLDDER